MADKHSVNARVFVCVPVRTISRTDLVCLLPANKSPAWISPAGLLCELPTAVATVMPMVAATTTTEIEADARTTAAIIPPMVMAVTAVVNLFRYRRNPGAGEAGQA